MLTIAIFPLVRSGRKLKKIQGKTETDKYTSVAQKIVSQRGDLLSQEKLC